MSSSGTGSSGTGSSGSKPGPARQQGPTEALDALLRGAAGDPVRRALWLDALDQRLRVHLPPPLDAHARLANVDGDRLVFLVDAPVWHARLRMAGPGLLDAARSLGLQVATLAIRVEAPAVDTAGGAGPRARPMSEASRRALQAALDSLDQGSGPPGPGTGEGNPSGRGAG